MKVKTAAKAKDTMPEKINSSNKNGGGERINATAKTVDKAVKRATGFGQEEESSKSSEILKSIVYGGLQTIIISLCLVAFLAAFNAPATIIERVALACIIGGIFFFVYNLWEFKRRSCNNGKSSNKTAEKYKEQLGRVNYFPMHAGVAILSFIVFGMIPPVSFLFLETRSKDLSMALVEVVSLLSVALLAIFKVSAINYKDYFQHVINLPYYLAYAVSRSICSYLVGYVAKKLMGELGFKFY